ncbi:MAG: MarR family transcriptional regulator [Bdellovibrionales bacterium]|nr:MarR family transcriptional regulator [Bdellovibrionales bacterium]
MDDVVLAPELKEELVHFETFLQRIGFKRLEGAVWGILVLADRPLTSEEIEKELALSQSAVSQALKKLVHFGAVEVRENRDTRAKTHVAKEDSLSIVATVFRKREQEAVLEFRQMAERALKKTRNSDSPSREKRLQSMIQTCDMALAVMDFVMTLVVRGLEQQYPSIVKRLPKALELVSQTAIPFAEGANQLANNIASKVKENFLKKITGDFHAQ